MCGSIKSTRHPMLRIFSTLPLLRQLRKTRRHSERSSGRLCDRNGVEEPSPRDAYGTAGQSLTVTGGGGGGERTHLPAASARFCQRSFTAFRLRLRPRRNSVQDDGVFFNAPRLLACLLALLAFVLPARAQELREQPTPFSVWLDFHALASASPPRISLPIWLASLGTERIAARDGAPATTIHRLHFRRVGDLNNSLQLRLFFDDQPGTAPTIIGWSETGAARFARGPFGSGLGLPTSENLTLPMDGVDYVDITTFGDGTNIRGVFLASLKRAETQHALDHAPPAAVADAFGNLPASALDADDYSLYGRVKASLDPGVMKFTPQETPAGSWEFELQSPPLTAFVTFEILNADALAPLEITVNDRLLGPVSVHQPDLADPAYIGLVRPLERDMRFRYAGWLRGQKAIPGSALRAGLNKVVLRLSRDSGPLAVRTVELQLKYNSPALDYNLAPNTP